MLPKINFDKKTEGKITDRDRKKIINKYRELLQLSEDFTKKKELELIRKAFDVALDASGVKRSPSGDPAILDTLEIAVIVVDQIGLGTRSVVASLLYQAVIDKKITIGEIEKEFDKTIKLIAFQNIQSELDKKEVESWQKIIRVLTHEIMNSVSPIDSATTSISRLYKIGNTPIKPTKNATNTVNVEA